jgi:octaprenyl-diphosphate synthase
MVLGLAFAARAEQGAAMTADVVPLRPRAAEPSLNPMLALTAQGMNSVNAVILDRMQSEVPLIPTLAGHLIAGGGKRLRPMLTVAGAELCGYQGNRHHKLAAAVEFIHTATLLHDDVVDGSDLRRGKATANIVFGNPATVLVGDFLFTRAFELMVEDGSLKVLKILSKASSVIAEGEVDQLTAQRHIETSEERYLGIIGSKTAALFAAATRIAAVVAEKSEAEERALEDYGRNLGIAFQLVDDAMDYDSETGEMGKGKGDDFREGKMTLPVILAYARGTEDERSFWRDAIAGFRAEDEDLAHAVELIGRHDTVSATRERARHFAQRAIDAIAGFPAGEARTAMAEAAMFAVARRY